MSEMKIAAALGYLSLLVPFLQAFSGKEEHRWIRWRQYDHTVFRGSELYMLPSYYLSNMFMEKAVIHRKIIQSETLDGIDSIKEARNTFFSFNFIFSKLFAWYFISYGILAAFSLIYASSLVLFGTFYSCVLCCCNFPKKCIPSTKGLAFTVIRLQLLHRYLVTVIALILIVWTFIVGANYHVSQQLTGGGQTVMKDSLNNMDIYRNKTIESFKNNPMARLKSDKANLFPINKKWGYYERLQNSHGVTELYTNLNHLANSQLQSDYATYMRNAKQIYDMSRRIRTNLTNSFAKVLNDRLSAYEQEYSNFKQVRNTILFNRRVLLYKLNVRISSAIYDTTGHSLEGLNKIIAKRLRKIGIVGKIENELEKVLSSLDKWNFVEASKKLTTVNAYMQRVGSIFYDLVIAATLMILVPFIFICIMLLCWREKKKATSTGSCCKFESVKASGYASVSIVLLCLQGGALMTLASLMMVVGSVSYTGCRQLGSFDDTFEMRFLSRLASHEIGVTVDLSAPMDRCYQNLSLMQAIDIPEVNQIFRSVFSTIRDSTEVVKRQLVAKAKLRIKQLERSIIATPSGNLQIGIKLQIADHIRGLSKSILGLENLSRPQRDILSASDAFLGQSTNTMLNSEINNMTRLIRKALQFHENLKLSMKSVANVGDIERKLTAADNQLNMRLIRNGSIVDTLVIPMVYDDLLGPWMETVTYIEDFIHYDLGKCRLLYNVVQTLVWNFCGKFLVPFNTLWFNIGILTILYLPLVIILYIIRCYYIGIYIQSVEFHRVAGVNSGHHFLGYQSAKNLETENSGQKETETKDKGVARLDSPIRANKATSFATPISYTDVRNHKTISLTDN